MGIATDRQPAPKGIGVDIVSRVMNDIEERAKVGEKKYGERLRAFNGRSSILDAYHEVLDLAVYLRQYITEESHTEIALRELRKEVLILRAQLENKEV